MERERARSLARSLFLSDARHPLTQGGTRHGSRPPWPRTPRSPPPAGARTRRGGCEWERERAWARERAFVRPQKPTRPSPLFQHTDPGRPHARPGRRRAWQGPAAALLRACRDGGRGREREKERGPGQLSTLASLFQAGAPPPPPLPPHTIHPAHPHSSWPRDWPARPAWSPRHIGCIR